MRRPKPDTSKAEGAEFSVDQLMAKARARRKAKEKGGKESDFVGRPGYRRKYVPGKVNADGTPYYTWSYSVPTRSRQAQEIAEAMAPRWRDENDMQREAAAQRPKERAHHGRTFFMGELSESDFCPTCGYRWTWCEGHG